MALVVDRGAVLLVLGKVGVVRILRCGVWVDVVERMRPGVAGEHGEAVAEGVAKV